MGTTQCVSRTVLHVAESTNGVTFLTFCQDHKTCPFTVVVFPDDLKKVGDIQQLEGRMVEIKRYDFKITTDVRRSSYVTRTNSARARSSSFLRCPPDYDVERRGHYSAGKYSHPKAKKSHKKQGAPISIEDPGEPQKQPPLMIRAPHTNPLRNSSSGYFVPRHTMPSFQSV